VFKNYRPLQGQALEEFNAGTGTVLCFSELLRCLFSRIKSYAQRLQLWNA